MLNQLTYSLPKINLLQSCKLRTAQPVSYQMDVNPPSSLAGSLGHV